MKLPENIPEISPDGKPSHYKIKLYIKGIARDVTPASLLSKSTLTDGRFWLATNLEPVTKAALKQVFATKTPIKIIVEDLAASPKKVISNENYLIVAIEDINNDSSEPRSINNDLVTLQRLIRE